MIKILINAYACAPNMGSEPGMGWNWIVNLAKYCEVYVITEGEWKNEIEEALMSLPQEKNIHFFYKPVSNNIRKMCWNQGDWRFYYHYEKWQREVEKMAVEIIKNKNIDIVHQLNMIGFREPGYLWKIKNMPFVWGPIGGIKNFPEAYLGEATLKQKAFIKLKNKVNNLQIQYSPRVKKALHNADLLISAIPESQNAIIKYHNLDSVLIPETGCYFNEVEDGDDGLILDKDDFFNIVWAGKFDLRKQLEIALKSLHRLKMLPIRLHVIGTGNEQQIQKYKKIVNKFSIEANIIWHGVIPNKNVLKIMKASNLFLFTSVSEDTSTVVMEALSCNLPIVCFDACGFGPVVSEEVGIKIKFSNPEQSSIDFAKIIKKLYNDRDRLEQMARNCTRRQQELLWDKKVEYLHGLYKKTLLNYKTVDIVN